MWKQKATLSRDHRQKKIAYCRKHRLVTAWHQKWRNSPVTSRFAYLSIITLSYLSTTLYYFLQPTRFLSFSCWFLRKFLQMYTNSRKMIMRMVKAPSMVWDAKLIINIGFLMVSCDLLLSGAHIYPNLSGREFEFELWLPKIFTLLSVGVGIMRRCHGDVMPAFAALKPALI